VAAAETVKRVLLSLAVGAGVGTVAAILIAPVMIEWWASPAIPTVCSCTEQISWALSRMQTSLAISSGVFALLGAIAVEVIRWARGKRAAA
jgi:hypothetical protein